jgi:hypothetical protein
MLGIYCGDSNPPIHISSSFFIHFQSVISIGKLGLGGYGFKLKYHLSGKIKKKLGTDSTKQKKIVFCSYNCLNPP